MLFDKEAIKRKCLVFPMSAPHGLEKAPGVTDCSLATGGLNPGWSEQLLAAQATSSPKICKTYSLFYLGLSGATFGKNNI